MKILTYGALNLDFVYRLPHICMPGETISAKSLQINCGGNVEKLMQTYPNASVMLTLGHRGCVCYHEGKRYPYGIYKTNVVDTTAAGDTFSGYFIASLVAGKSMEEAIAQATKASSVVVSRTGAHPSIPYPAEVEAHDGQYVHYEEQA